ncbi:type II toxin-antitoxin system RelE family toxin [Arthrobacter sp.]|uniref:type II toxin-antitoxin system RelE family toxin n=1 Tax=Arthrobacter sp. TaxID=1667 RepID=UPI003A927879
MADVFLTDDAKADLARLDQSTRLLVFKGLKTLADEPEKRGSPLGSRRTGDLTGLRKLVVGNGDWRIVYRVEADGSVCVVWVIGKRADDEVYDIAMARLERHRSPAGVVEMERALKEAFRKPQ